MSHTIERPEASDVLGDTKLIESDSSTLAHYIHCDEFGPDLRSLDWEPAMSSINGRFLVPLFETPLEDFLEFLHSSFGLMALVTDKSIPITLTTKPPKDAWPLGHFHLVVKSAYTHQGQKGLCLGGAIFPNESIVDLNLVCNDLRTFDYPPIGDIRAQTKLARTRSLSLLTEHLTSEQKQEFRKHKWFSVIGSNGKTYVITTKTHGNVWLVEDGVPTANYCIVMPGVPVFDQMLGQKLLIQTDITTMESIANKTTNSSWTMRSLDSDDRPLQREHITITTEDFQEGRLQEILTQIDARRTA